MFQMSSVSLTNGNYIHILMPDCCFIRLLVGYSFLVAGIILAGAAERQEGGSSSRLRCRAAPGCFQEATGERPEHQTKIWQRRTTGGRVPRYSRVKLVTGPDTEVSGS